MLKICLGFWKSEPWYAYKRYAYKKTFTTWLMGVKKLETICTWLAQKVDNLTSSVCPLVNYAILSKYSWLPVQLFLHLFEETSQHVSKLLTRLVLTETWEWLSGFTLFNEV